MKFVFASYVQENNFNDPMLWLNRIKAYSGILKELSLSHEVTSIEQINYEGTLFEDGVHYHFLKIAGSSKYFPEKLHRHIKTLAPDVIVIHGLHFPLQVIQLRLSLGKKVKIIVQNHAEKPFNGIKKYLQRWADNFADAYFFASREMGLDWIKKGNLGSPHKIYEVMELSSIFYPINKQEAWSISGVNGEPIFLWVGRLNQNKNPVNVVKAFLKFAAVQPAARLYMIYQTYELLSEIKELVKNHSNNNNAIILVGKLPNDELLYWYNSADFILSGSSYEGSGTAICEAMSCGCIPVVTDIFSFRMITNGGRCGILYEAGNQAALLTALLQTSHINLEEQRKTCLECFQSNLSFKAIANRFGTIAAKLRTQADG